MKAASDVEAELARARREGDLHTFLELLAGEELFVPLLREDADAVLDGRAESFPNLFFDTDGVRHLQVYTRGALPDLGAEVVFTSAALDWWVADLDDVERVVFNRGTLAEWRVTGAEVTPWLDVNAAGVRPVEDQSERLITARYGHLDGPLAHALACGAHLAVLNASPWNVLDATRHDYLAEIRGLREWWGVEDAAGWREVMADLIGDGYALTPGNLVLMLRLRFAAERGLSGGEVDPVAWAGLVREWCVDSDVDGEQAEVLRETVGRVTRYEKRFRADGLIEPDGFVTTALAWDIGRAVNVARWGLAVGYCDALTAELMVMEAGSLARRHHRSWTDLSAGYIMGRVLHFDEEEYGDWYLSAVRIHHLLAGDPASPWVNLGFDPLGETTGDAPA